MSSDAPNSLDLASSDTTVVQSLQAEAATATKKTTVGAWLFDLPQTEIDAATHYPLTKLAEPILSILSELRRPQERVDLAKLRHRLTLEINSLTVKARNAQAPENKVLLLRYLLCAVIDEFVLDTPWGANSSWSAHSLLNAFHQDSAGGEKFFVILDKMQLEAINNIDVLMVAYFCLSLGFVGKYRVTQGGKDQLVKIKTKLYQVIVSHLGERELGFVCKFTVLDPKKVNETKRIPILKIIGVVLTSLVLIYGVFSVLLYQKKQHVVSALHQVIVDNGVLSEQSSRKNL